MNASFEIVITEDDVRAAMAADVAAFDALPAEVRAAIANSATGDPYLLKTATDLLARNLPGAFVARAIEKIDASIVKLRSKKDDQNV